MFKEKLPAYILPVYPLMAVMTARNVNALFGNSIIKKMSYSLLSPSVILFFVIPFVWKDHLNILVSFVFGVITLCFFVYILRQNNLKEMAYFIIITSLFIYFLLPCIEEEIKGYKKLAERIMTADPEKRIDIITYECDLPSLSFYTGRIVKAAFGRKREIQFEHTDSYKNYYIQTQHELEQFLSLKKQFFLVARTYNSISKIISYGYKCNKIYSNPKYSVYHCFCVFE